MPPHHSLQSDILAARQQRRADSDPARPVAWFEEFEANGLGELASVLTLVLTASECPWKCVMCDLWKHTLPQPTPLHAIPTQIRYVLEQLHSQHTGPSHRHDWVKLYNSGSFFDRKSVPPQDYHSIAKLVSNYSRVIVENHPRLCSSAVGDFQQLMGTQLEVALGVESVQPGLLRRLNKGMDRTDVDKAIQLLHSHEVTTRAFVLIRPPWNLESEAIRWTQLSIRHLCRLGVRHISLIPVRAGNGWMDTLEHRGEFTPPSIPTVEFLLEWGFAEAERVGREKTVITVDLWDWAPPHQCVACFERRRERMHSMNLSQRIVPAVTCASCR